MRLGNSLLDPSENKLYVYELYDVSPKSSSIVVIDLDNPNDWKSISDLERSKQTHHHNALFDSSHKKIIILEVMDILATLMILAHMTLKLINGKYLILVEIK